MLDWFPYTCIIMQASLQTRLISIICIKSVSESLKKEFFS